MGDFLLNPYDATLDLKNKEDRKLFQDACRGLKEKDLFGGGRDKYTDFVKLIKREFYSTRVMEALQIATKWNTDAPTPDGKRAVAQDGIVNAFTTNKITRNEVVDHYNRVWGNVPFTDPTRKEFQHFEVAPTNDAELKEFRNRRRLKHVMMGQMLWNSLTSAFQIDIMPHKNEFQRGQEHDSPLLWDYIRRRVKPSTTVGASKLKDDIESKTLKDFDNDVTRYNSWFTDTRDQIIREEGDGYNEYMRSLFRAYRTSPNEDFRDAIASEKRNWTQGKLPDHYTHHDLMVLARLEYNNSVEDDSWDSNKSKLEHGKDDANILALATEILRNVTSTQNGKQPKDGPNLTGEANGKQFQAWRFQNPDNAKTKLVRGSTMTWCTKDCHQQPMWCGRKRCLSKTEYATMMADKRDGKGKAKVDSPNNGSKVSNDVRNAVAALTTPDDFAALESQFMSGKD